MPMALDMAVAEHAIMFLLALPKNLINTHNFVAREIMRKWAFAIGHHGDGMEDDHWCRLKLGGVYHKTLGMIGLGTSGLQWLRG
jgi:lactate dehydrogenase-like 2-hydroxyacid dehydrogenase